MEAILEETLNIREVKYTKKIVKEKEYFGYFGPDIERSVIEIGEPKETKQD